MATKPTFSQEISNMLYATHGNPIKSCIQCGTCSGTCPVADFMDHSPRRLIGLINANQKEEVLTSNTYWFCASCYYCNVRCPSGIDIADVMYAVKRYSIWKNQYKEGLIGPTFSETFVKTVQRNGRSYEPLVTMPYLFSSSMRDILKEAQTATSLMLKGRVPVIPERIDRIENFKRVINRIIPTGGAS